MNRGWKASAGIGLFLGVGAALLGLGLSGSRPTGQRVLYVVAAVMFLLAGVMRMYRLRQQPDRTAGQAS